MGVPERNREGCDEPKAGERIDIRARDGHQIDPPTSCELARSKSLGRTHSSGEPIDAGGGLNQRCELAESAIDRG
jgi:hypothetical protein